MKKTTDTPETEAVIDTPETEKMVKIRIPRDSKAQEDVYVSINQRSWLIKRGVEVEVPECVAALLQDAEDAKEAAYAYQDAHSVPV